MRGEYGGFLEEGEDCSVVWKGSDEGVVERNDGGGEVWREGGGCRERWTGVG